MDRNTQGEHRELMRLLRASQWEEEWRRDHIPTEKRLKKTGDKYTIEQCPHCVRLGIA